MRVSAIPGDPSLETLRPGACLGFTDRESFAAGGGEMLVWEKQSGGLLARHVPFHGLRPAGVDLLFVAAPEVWRAQKEAGPEEILPRLKESLRQGRVIMYVLKSQAELRALGYEYLLEALGYAFLGTCLG